MVSRLLLIIILITSCQYHDAKRSTDQAQVELDTSKSVSNKNSITAIKSIPKADISKIEISKGLIIFNNTIGNHNSIFKLYYGNGKLANSFSFQSPFNELDSIVPFAWHPEYFLLVFRCANKEGDFYEVIGSEKTNMLRYIDSRDTVFKFTTWHNFLSNNVFAIDFDSTVNMIRKEPNKSSESIPYSRDDIYLPVKVVNEWLQVEWGEPQDFKYGWVQWEKDNMLAIDLFYF